jgi:dipeptidyl aminopeptidase/acylaminoacyl peptidase
MTGLAAGIIAVLVAFSARRMVAPARQSLWMTPADLGLAYENVQFPAQDGVRLSGWFLPVVNQSPRKGATVVLVHGWGWNRLGDAARDVMASVTSSTPVEFLRLAHVLHQEGFHVLTFDLRNHGQSAASPPVTFGQQEANDLLGALAYLETRPDVDAGRIGVIGFSMGGNTVLYALPQTDRIKAAVAVEPTSAALYARRFARDVFGALGGILLSLTELLYRAAGGVPLTSYQPAFAAAGAGETPVLYVQGKNDRWGSVEDVAQMAAATPQAQGPLFVDGVHHYQGLQYLLDNPKIAVTFFEKHL